MNSIKRAAKAVVKTAEIRHHVAMGRTRLAAHRQNPQRSTANLRKELKEKALSVKKSIEQKLG